MDIREAYDREIERIESSDLSPEEKRDEIHWVENDMREHDEARQAEHDDVDRRYGY